MTESIITRDSRYAAMLAESQKRVRAIFEKMYSRWIINIALMGEIELRLQQLVPHIVGYDPQKLLPSPERLQREWIVGMIDLFCSPTIDLRKHFDVPVLIPGDTIHMTPLVTPFVGTAQMADWREIEQRVMAGHMAMHVYIDTSDDLDRRWNVMSDIVKAPPALEDYDIPVKTSAGLRDKSYLKHDPSKKHRRRRR